jgi:hypothetical protein
MLLPLLLPHSALLLRWLVLLLLLLLQVAHLLRVTRWCIWARTPTGRALTFHCCLRKPLLLLLLLLLLQVGHLLRLTR